MMSETKLKPIFSGFNLILLGLLLFSASSCFGAITPATPQGEMLGSFVPYFNSGNGHWYIQNFHIGQSFFSTSDCNYNSNNQTWSVAVYPSSETYPSRGDYAFYRGLTIPNSDLVSQGYYNFDIQRLGGGDYETGAYPATGQYWLQYERFNPSNGLQCGFQGYSLYYVDKTTDIFSELSTLADGVCGSGHDGYVSSEPAGSVACSSGTISGMTSGQNELHTETFYNWNCDGSGGGSSSSCWAIMSAPIDGVCGSADGQTISAEPNASEMCSGGYNGGSLSTTLYGWTWSCYGMNNGANDFCSANLSTSPAPPDVPDSSDIPTETDCSTYTGIDNVVCNIGNSIQGIFLPSTDKVQELQTTINQVGNVFPFNYLRVISTIFSGISAPTTSSLTMTILGNTATLDDSFFDFAIIEAIRNFFTVLIIIAFVFWAIGYIKHFFK